MPKSGVIALSAASTAVVASFVILRMGAKNIEGRFTLR
jgi:hypothetical protein